MGEVEFLNRQTLEYFGKTTEELRNWALIDAVHPDDLPHVIETRKRSIESGEIYEVEHRCRRADGVYRWFQVRGLPVRNAQGALSAWYLLLTDIDDLKQAEEALQSSERILRQITNVIPSNIHVLRTDGSVLYVNQAVLDFHGTTLEDVQKQDYRARFFHPDDTERLGTQRSDALLRPVPFENEQRALGKDGKYHWFMIRYNPLLDEQGKVDRWYVAALDIEDRKRTEEALRKSERQFRLLVETIPALVWRSTPEGDLDYLNRRAVEYLGHTAESLAGGRWLELVHPDHRDATLQRWMHSATTGTAYEDEYQLRRADDQYRWIQSVGEPFRDTEGRIANWYGVVLDIDDRKRAEEALQARELDARSLLDNMPGFLGRHSPDGTPEIVNRPFLQYQGRAVEEIGQWRTSDVVHRDDLAQVTEGLASGISGGQPWDLEFRLRRFDGAYRWFQARWAPVRDGEGRILHWNVLTTDIDDRKLAEDALARHAGVRAEVSVAFSKPTPLGEILRGCTEAIVRHLDAAFARIWMLNQDESILELQASSGMYTRLDGSYSRISVGDLKVGLIAREKSAHFTNDVPNDLRVKDKSWAQRNGMVAFAGHPLVVEDRLIGVIALFARQPLPESIPDTLASVADTIAQGIERRRAEDSLRSALDEVQQSEAKLRQVFDTIPALAWCNMPDGTNEFLNQGWHEYTGLSHEQSHGWGWQQAFHPDDLPPLMKKWTKMLVSGEPDEVEARLRRSDGVYRWFLIRAQPFRDESGNILRWYGTSTDIDDLKQTEGALRSSERNLRQITNAIPTNIHVLRPDGSVLYVNQPVLDYTGLTIEETLRDDYRGRVFHPEDLKTIREDRLGALTRPELFENEQRALGKDGKYRWFWARYNPLLDERGRIERWYVASVDIEDRKRAEAEIEQAYLRLAEAQRVSKTGSFITDLKVDQHNWSEELCRIFELDPGTRVTTEAIRALFHPEDLPIYEDAFKRAIDGGDRDLDISYRIITPAGNLKHLHAVAHVLEQIEGRPIYIGAIQDVTESKIAEQALTRARAELAHMARVTMLSALTASIAHEINQPIAATVASAGACLRWLNREEPEVQRARDAAQRIEDDGKRAAEIIARLKAFYRKDFSPQRESVPINEIVGEMLLLLRSESDRHSVQMNTELASGLPPVSADRVLLQQVLMNLMLNAMEAMGQQGGELNISTRREGEAVTVSVSDTGVGIPSDQVDQIFSEFFTTKLGGTGLGLAISRSIIESHGGRIWATKNSPRGATFQFNLPIRPEAFS